MLRLKEIFLLFSIIFSTSAQISPLLVISYIRVYTPPPLTFQAILGGGFRAYLPDDCGVEKFEFKCKTKKEAEWKGGNVTSKTDGHWIYEDPGLFLNPGDHLFYTGAVTNRGRSVPLHPDAEWVVPENLPNEFSPPVIQEPPQCPKEQPEKEETPEENKTPENENPDKNNTTESPESQDVTTNKPDTTSETTSTSTTSTSTTSTTTISTTTEILLEKPQCPWVDITPSDTKEKALQNSLGRLQCDLASFALRTVKLNQQLTEELIDLKKLNYATVARMQRLESLLRSIPRGIPYPLY